MRFLWAVPILSLAEGSVQQDASSLLQVQGHATKDGPVQLAWNRQVNAFDRQAVDFKLLDYSEDAVLNFYNNIGGSLVVYKGITRVREFFEDELFPNLSEPFDTPTVADVVNEAVFALPGNVLLVWSSAASGYTQATDTFVFDADSKILRQNVAVSYNDPRGTGAKPRPIPAEVVPTGQGPVHTGWAHHFEALRRRNIRILLRDYLDISVITFHNQADSSKAIYHRRSGIKEFYRSLFANLTDTCDLAAPVQLVEESPPGVFLTWSSRACGYSTGTDTLIFNREGKIVRHNVVVNYRRP